MLLASLISLLLLQAPVLQTPDSLLATITINSTRPTSPSIDWMLLDSANKLIESGRTPSELSRTLSQTTETICATDPSQYIAVTLKVMGKSTELNGSARCMRFGIVDGRVGLDATPGPESRGRP
jgi:hypothetical protein